MEWEKLYKGFIRSQGKEPKEAYKNVTNFKSYEEIRNDKHFCGILRDDVILIDIDDMEQSEILMNIVEDLQLNCRVYKTSRGRHFVFKNTVVTKCSTKTHLACGLVADIKTGGMPEALKIDYKERFIEWDIEDNEEYDELPYYLYPIKVKKDFIGLEEGDGRNQSLFNYILTLQSNSLTKEQIRDTITIINKYIFKDPLNKKELETILRDEAFEKPNFYDNGKLDVNGFAKFLINNERICKINYQLYIFNGEIYMTGKSYMEATMIKYIPNLLSAKRTEVYRMIELLMKNEKEVKYAAPNYIAFKNGIYNLKENKLLDFAPDIVITNQIPWNYNPNANNLEIKDILSNWVSHDKKTLMLLEECIGMCMYRKNNYGTSFILTGDKDNGKSTFLNMLKALLGKENYSTIPLHSLEKRFLNTDIVGKLANLGDDIGDEYIAKTEVFKKLVTGETVQFEKKGQDAFYYDNYSKLIFNANEIPNIKDPTGAVIDKRLIIIPFNITYVKGTKNRNLSEKFDSDKEMMETLILLGIDGIKRVLKNDEFTYSELVDKTKKDYQYKNDVVAKFIDEFGVDNIHFENANKVLNEYKQFCNREESLSKSPQILNKGIKRILGYEKIKFNYKENGKIKTIYYYAKKNEILPRENEKELKSR